ncbi:MAG: pyridoxamine 5'-phosphate oxidase family protein [Gemmatimonadetes bacterium]|nr:pyridoxamine 5'-phosphate oxidase family protein [Gemmatimonadota bacterium]
MTRLVGSELPPDLVRRFSAKTLERYAQNVVPIITEGEDGWPHPAMLSHFEIVARDAQNLRLAISADSRTTGNMRRTGRLTIVVVDAGIAYYLKGTVEELLPSMKLAPHNALLNFRVEQVLADHVDVEREGEPVITSGMTYRDPNLATKLACATSIFEEMLA